MKISHLLIISISILFLIYALHSYVSYDFAIKEAKQSALLRNQAQATNIMRDLDRYIDGRVNNFNDLAKIEEIRHDVANSNLESASAPQDTDAESLGSEAHLQVESTQKIYDSISEELRDIIEFYKKEYDYDVINELIITNKYGNQIISDNSNSGNRYDSTTWWMATKEKRIFIGDLEYDQRYNTHALIVAYPILDENEEFVGSMRVTVSIKDLLHDFLLDADILSESKKNVVLLDNEGSIIYEKGTYYPETNKPYFEKLVGETGTIEHVDTSTKLISYASSIGYKDFKGFDWKVVVEQEDSVVLSDFVELRNNMLISTTVGIGSAVALSFMLSHFVTTPLSQISKLTTRLGKGDFDTKLQKSKISEIDSIVQSFNNMELALKKLLETEKQLAEANARVKNERLTAIGELAASMAHDMKNPLGTIRSGIDIMKRYAKSDDQLDEVMHRMDRAISRMSHQVEDVLNYVRFTPLDVKPIMIHSVIKSTLNAIEIPKSIEVEIIGEDAEVFCDERKMEIVFINLILNSVQAIGGNPGNITIRTLPDKDRVTVQIEDTGPGIPPEVESDIFKPLVTTKQKGTGLGLASCKNIIEQHGGSISFANNPTTFTIELPMRQI